MRPVAEILDELLEWLTIHKDWNHGVDDRDDLWRSWLLGDKHNGPKIPKEFVRELLLSQPDTAVGDILDQWRQDRDVSDISGYAPDFFGEYFKSIDSDCLLEEIRDRADNTSVAFYDSISDMIDVALCHFDIVDVISELKKRVDLLPSDFPRKYSKNGIPLF